MTSSKLQVSAGLGGLVGTYHNQFRAKQHLGYHEASTVVMGHSLKVCWGKHTADVKEFKFSSSVSLFLEDQFNVVKLGYSTHNCFQININTLR